MSNTHTKVARVIEPAIIADIRSRRGESKLFVSVGEDQPEVIFRYERGELIADDLNDIQFARLAGTPGIQREGEEAPVRDLSGLVKDHYNSQALTDNSGKATIPNSAGELTTLFTEVVNRLANLGAPVPNTASAPTAPAVTRQELAAATLDDPALEQLLALLEAQGATVDRDAKGWKLSAFANIARFAKSDAKLNDGVLEIVDASALRAEIAAIEPAAIEPAEVKPPVAPVIVTPKAVAAKIKGK